MKIVCTTESVIEKKESCRKTYCCNRLKIAMNPYKSGYDNLCSTFTIGEKKVKLTTHHSYHDGDHDMSVDFCCFCGKPLIVEHKKVDKTGLPPKLKPKPAPKPPVLKATSPPPPLKKKHWWSR